MVHGCDRLARREQASGEELTRQQRGAWLGRRDMRKCSTLRTSMCTRDADADADGCAGGGGGWATAANVITSLLSSASFACRRQAGRQAGSQACDRVRRGARCFRASPPKGRAGGESSVSCDPVNCRRTPGRCDVSSGRECEVCGHRLVVFAVRHLPRLPWQQQRRCASGRRRTRHCVCSHRGPRSVL
jgi:hypothetical protein